MTAKRRFDALLTRAPMLVTFEAFVDLGGHLQVQADRKRIPDPIFRVETLKTAARTLSVPLQSMATSRFPRKVDYWFWLPGDRAVVSVQLCECHDGAAATTGEFADREAVIAAAVGQAMRDLMPAELHPQLGAAEALIDAELALRPTRVAVAR